ncbi:MAG: DNA-directed RNA polymerase subunit B, partial [Candidatus Diapherotrites archaeon]|nr:DNA-directed RNA polymerase subunit B [Candidatus Diapherotrites archaeon]
MANLAKVYINGRLIGFHEDASKLNKIAIEARRQGALPKETNVAHHKDTNEIYINTDAGRLQRP